MRFITLLIIGFVACCLHTAAAETFTYIDLVNRLTDLEQLAILPQPGEKCAQWSSYDRKSRYDQATGKYIQWGANGDGTGFIRKENGKLVLAEMDGPGVIWRIWSAAPRDGHVRIYLDGNQKPAIDLPFKNYFDMTQKPFTRPALGYIASGGANSYIPIPYQKSCKVVADKNWGMYYHFTYTTYPPGTRLPTFTRDLSPAETAALDKANKILANCGTDPAGKRPGEVTEKVKVTVPAGKTVKVVDILGARAITALKVKMDVPAITGEFGVLRELALSISWDDEQQPSVWSPLGDFFGSAPGAAIYRSLPLGMTDDGFYSYWYMPFRRRALVELTNDGDQEQTVAFNITHAPLRILRFSKNLGYFNARWHRDADLDPARPVDWTILKTSGRGRFCGVMLYIWNPRGGWWGEGDEKFFVDGEKFPSTFGTGSEDYFGYAWCSHVLFNRAYHNQTVSVENNGCAHPTPIESGGHICNNRFHLGDNLPFHKSFEGAIEKYFTNQRLTRYSCVPYWYQTPSPRPRAPLAPVEERLFVKEADEMNLYRFLRDVNEYTGSGPIEPLRTTYQHMIKAEGLTDYYMELTLKMARAEKMAGNKALAEKLVEPYIESLSEPFIARVYADDIMQLLDMPASPAGKVKALLVPSFDGSDKRIKKAGRWCIVTQQQKKKQYIYFSMPDKPGLRKVNRTAKFHITCYRDAQSENSFRIQYNSPNNPYRDSENVIIPAGNPGWHTITIECPRAKFTGRQNDRADFRIAATGKKDLHISNLEVELLK
ncbi:MAG: glycoside hydrolase family 172 protein [Planctomycetota bacterium]|jgi:hypothetical protein